MTRHLHRVLAVASVLLASVPGVALAQQTTVSGKVQSDAQVPVEGVSVSIASLGVGAYTNAQGTYTFTVPASRARGQTVTITARRIGFTPKTTTVTLTSGGAITQDFTMTAAPTELTGIVVTALGLQREKSELGTAVQTLNTNDVTQTKAQNIVDDMSGKVAGVQVTSSANPGGSSYITIRGISSILGDNQPLFIVDGVPISHQDHGASANSGYDFGNAINDINPDDIESMTVLKGPNAAALYGSRAANGVILITTKSGKSTSGSMRVDANSYVTFENPSRLPNYQNQYGQGAGGEFNYVDGAGGGVNDGADQSWGPQLDGRTTGCVFTPATNRNDPIHIPASAYDQSQPCDQFTAVTGGPWIAHPNNVQDFFQTGRTASATVAVSGGNDRANGRLSAGRDNVTSIIPGSFITKTNASINGTLQLSNRLSTNAAVNYIRNTGLDRPGQGYSNSILESFVWFGRQVDMTALKDNWMNSATLNNGPAGREFNWNYDYHNNPYFLMYGDPEADTRDRIIGDASATYKLADWVNFTGRVSNDWYTWGFNQDWSPADITGGGANPAYNGGFANTNEYHNEVNTEGLFTVNRQLRAFAVNGTFGGNVRKEIYHYNSVSTPGISAPGIYNVSNAAVAPSNSQTDQLRQVNSLYGSAAFTYDGWWTVEGTARNDWSSTLPKGANSYFYPSINTSIVLSDRFPGIRKGGLSYLKIRGADAQVGNDASPYQLRATYSGLSSKLNGQPQFTLSNTLANPTLKPEITTSAEGGAEAGFLDGRIDLDATYYDKETRNEIFPVSISTASGFSSATVNAGRVKNEGFEALLTVQALQLSNGFHWTSSFNFSKNASRVVTLYPGVTAINIGSAWNVNIQARVGQPYGTLFGPGYARDSATGEILTNGGLPVSGSKIILGNISPDWLGGWNNTFTYKNFSLSGLLDIHEGGNMWSITNFWGDYAGVLQSSLLGREVAWNKPGVVVHGIDQATGKQNTDTVTAEQYFQNIYPTTEGYVYKDSWIKLRELRFGYDLSPEMSAKLHANAVNLALTGRNLYTWTKVPNIDPEVSYSSGTSTQGEEYASIPNSRSIGISVRVTP